MDKFDQHILQILRLNARSSVSDIARDVNLSRSAVTARIKKLEQDRVILGYHAEILENNSEELLRAYLALKYDTSSSDTRCETYAETFRQIEGVKWCHAISGETDMMLYLEVPGMSHINKIREEIQAIPEMKQVLTHVVMTEFFNTTK
ncbi:ArsR family transcriptional regulator [Veronia nyctiphanis]|uniref:ArsR family transcriptional regulator n=1 Tax=Veronia nyctiphanis TaxID=1278244 RepID=A0A4Q0YQG5_9GAMM|nr:Lrp/AsnC family transcriptional regulator [Veronia nyctiphanis]RXJ72815.1 ArsR family transcriptional regulator [Veronia nyctiphanis]